MTLNHEIEVRTLEGEPMIDENFRVLVKRKMESWVDLPNYDKQDIMPFNEWWRTYDPPNLVDQIDEIIKWTKWSK